MTTLHGIATQRIATSNGLGIEAGSPVRVTETINGYFHIKGAGHRRASYLTWEQVIVRVQPA